jgi:hypothetical protein
MQRTVAGARPVRWRMRNLPDSRSATFATTHQYTVPFVGAGGAISVNYHDVDYADNSGSLTLEIFAPAATATVSTAIPTLNEVGILALVLGIVVLTARRYREHKS